MERKISFVLAVLFLFVCAGFLTMWQKQIPKPQPKQVQNDEVKLIPPIQPHDNDPYDPYSKFVKPLLKKEEASLEVPYRRHD